MFLVAGTPGFVFQQQLCKANGMIGMNVLYFLFCDWESAWTLLYLPINKEEEAKINIEVERCNAIFLKKLTDEGVDEDDYRAWFKKTTGIVSIDNSEDDYESHYLCIDDPNLTSSCQLSAIRKKMTMTINLEMVNLDKNIFNQKTTELCVPISITSLLRYAIRNDLSYDSETDSYTFEMILITITMVIFPRSLAGLNLNPRKKEAQNQNSSDIELLFKRICQKTYLMMSGWDIIKQIGKDIDFQNQKSYCEFEKVTLNENFEFSRPLSVTAAISFEPGYVKFHQMTIDRVENNQYVLQNTEFKAKPDQGIHDTPVVRIDKDNPYYWEKVSYDGAGENYYEDDEIKLKYVNEMTGNMDLGVWYLCPEAFSLQLFPSSELSGNYHSDMRFARNTFLNMMMNRRTQEAFSRAFEQNPMNPFMLDFLNPHFSE